jgi:hypothetical protein
MLQVVCNVLLKVVCNVLFQVVAPSGTPGSLAVFKVMNPIRTSNQPWNAPSEPTKFEPTLEPFSPAKLWYSLFRYSLHSHAR